MADPKVTVVALRPGEQIRVCLLRRSDQDEVEDGDPDVFIINNFELKEKPRAAVEFYPNGLGFDDAVFNVAFPWSISTLEDIYICADGVCSEYQQFTTMLK